MLPPYLPFTPQPHSPLPHGGPLLSSQPSLPRRGQAAVPERLHSSASEIASSYDASSIQAGNIMDAAYRPPLGLKLTKSPSMVEWFTEQLEMQHYSHQPAGTQSHQESQPQQQQQQQQQQQSHPTAGLFGSWQHPQGPSISLASLKPGQGGLADQALRQQQQQEQEQDIGMDDDQPLSMTSSMMMEESCWDACSASTSATSPPSNTCLVTGALADMQLDDLPSRAQITHGFPCN